MARSAGNVVENKLIKGLVTEATGLNFPEDAVTETWDVVYEPKGVVRRRLGIDLEGNAVLYGQDTAGAIVEYLWYAVDQTGTRVFLVLQTGETIGFYELNTDENLSSHVKDFFVNLPTYQTAASMTIGIVPCQFASGNGRLFITHPGCNPIVVTYDSTSDTITKEEVTIQVRDFEGEDDSLDPDEEPATLSSSHHYNLKNQGWYKDEVLVVTSVTETKV